MASHSEAPKQTEGDAPAKKAESSDMSNILQHIKNLETNNNLKSKLNDDKVRNCKLSA